MKLNTNSNTYTILYACGVVIVVAFLLAFASSALSEKIGANERIDKMKQILSSLHVTPQGGNVEAEYAAIVKQDLIVNDKGEVKADKGGFDIAQKDINAGNLPFYACEVKGEKKYIIPLVGKGLWGTIWGYLALNDDCETVYGVYFGHASETAGLGSLIAEDANFKGQFVGKKIFDAEGNTLSVEKFGKADKNSPVQCDGISGATLTVNGVTAMLRDYVTMYKTYLLNLKK